MKKLWAMTLVGLICIVFAGGIEVVLGPDISGLGLTGLLAFAAGIGTIVLALGAANGLALLTGRVRPILAPIFIALVWTPAFYLVGDSLTEGGWIAQQSWVWMIPWAAGLAGGLGIFLGALILRRWPGSTPLTVALLLGAVVLWGIDARILPGLYPYPHLLLSGLAIQSILVAGWRLSDRIPEKFPRTLTAISATLLLIAPLAWFNLSAGLRAELFLRGGIATNLVQHLGRPFTANFLTQLLHELGPGTPVEADKTARKPIVDNVLFLFVDTLRFDALPPSRAKRGGTIRPADSPFLNSFLEGCYTFDRAYAQASATHQSIPPTFRSIEAWESAKDHGTALGLEYQDAGISTFAVVNNYFFEPRFDVTQRLLDGFESIHVYTVFEQNDVLPLTTEMLERHRSKRFFAWVHFMAMHDAGYDDEYLDPKKHSRKKRYQMSMRWTDRTFEKIVNELRQNGLLENTAIVLASDHGEGLGDNNVWNHGPTIYEEEIRVPLAICLPPSFGKAKTIDKTVGNIDVVPTFHELLGLPTNTHHRGTSLVPVLRGGEHAKTYYLSSYNSTMVGVYKDGQKLTYQPKQGIFLRFDLDQDPKEDTNLYGQDPELDEALRRELFFMNPSLLKEEAKTPVNQALIAEKIDQLDPHRPTDSLQFLIKLAAIEPSSLTDRAAADLLRTSRSELVRQWAMIHLGARETISEVVRERLERVAGENAEIEWVREVGDTRVEPADHSWVQRRLNELHDLELLEAWLRWTLVWKKGDDWVKTWEALIPRATSPTTQELLLRNIGKSDSKPLADLVSKSLVSEDGEVRTAALNQVLNYKDPNTLAAIRASLRGDNRRLRERQAAVPAFDAIRGAEEGLDELLDVAEHDEVLSLDIMQIFIKHKDVPRLKRLLALYPRLKRDIDWEIKQIQKKKK